MKKVIQFILFISLAAALNSDLVGQVQDLDTSKDNLVGSYYTNISKNKVYISWIPSNYDVWKSGIESGYKIERITKSINGVELELNEQIESKIVISPSVLPYSENKFNNTFANNDVGQALKKIHYSDEADIVITEDHNLSDAVNYYNQEESKYFMALMIANRGITFGKAAGLAIIDNNDIDPDAYYVYSVNSIGTDDIEGAYIDADILNASTLQKPTDLVGTGGNKVVLLSWDVDGENPYTAYNIYRKAEGETQYSLVNDEPMVPFVDPKSGLDEMYYRDSLTSNDVIYKYKVRGINHFGIKGPYSDIIEVQGRPDRLDFQMDINKIDGLEGEDLVIHWDGFDNALEPEIDHFNVFRLMTIQGQEEPLNTMPISSGARSFALADPVPEAYYIVQAVDNYGHEYRSTAMLGQVNDTTPPSKPSGLSGEIRDDGKAYVEWEANIEMDLKGYQVFYSNEVEGEYTQLTSTSLAEPHYTFNINPELGAEFIYIKTLAIDHRYNQSEKSDVLELKRPDLIPPSSPHLSYLEADADGIRLAWELSSSADVAKHILQRKFQNDDNWSVVISFESGNEPVQPDPIDGEAIPVDFVDTTSLELRYYDYRLLAEDEAGNQSVSSKKSIFPFDDGIRGHVRYIEFEVIERNPDGTVYLPGQGQQQGGNTGPSVPPTVQNPLGLANYEGRTYVYRYTQIKWQYISEFPSTLKSFKIYKRETYPSEHPPQGTAERPFVLVKNLTTYEALKIANEIGYNGFAFEDLNELEEGKAYNYKIVSVHAPSGGSPFSDMIFVE